MTESARTLQRTESNLFGDSTHVLSLSSDFMDLCNFWEEQMEE